MLQENCINHFMAKKKRRLDDDSERMGLQDKIFDCIIQGLDQIIAAKSAANANNEPISAPVNESRLI